MHDVVRLCEAVEMLRLDIKFAAVLISIASIIAAGLISISYITKR